MDLQLAIAVPFDRGALIASSGRVAKTAWGLVAGLGVREGFERAAAALGGTRRLGLPDIHRGLSEQSRLLSPPDGPSIPTPAWLFSFESEAAWSDPGPGATAGAAASLGDRSHAGLPVGIYRDRGDGPVAVSWGAVSLAGDRGGGFAEVLREGELRLQWDLDLGAGFQERFTAVTRVFAWYRAQWDWLPDEVELGIHEPDHRYSVDRVSLGGPDD